MGGEQVFVWTVAHPDFFDLAVPILGTPRLTSYDLQVKRIMVESILADPAYQSGNYTEEPPLKLPTCSATWLSPLPNSATRPRRATSSTSSMR
jgi:homoserine O-acetyltransferase